MIITSLQNTRVKDAVRLRERRHRDRERLTLVEGRDEVLLAMRAGVEIETLFLSAAAMERHEVPALAMGEIVGTTDEVFAKLAYRENPDGWLAVARTPDTSLEALALGPTSLVLVVDGVEKPGNIGAMARTADAAGAMLLLSGRGSDPWNPNAIRASRGAVFAVPAAVASQEEAIAALQAARLRIVAADPSAGESYTKADLAGGVAIVVGAEHQGLSQPWRSAAHHTVSIPMAGKVNSLNVSTSAALLLYEAVRQRENANARG